VRRKSRAKNDISPALKLRLRRANSKALLVEGVYNLETREKRRARKAGCVEGKGKKRLSATRAKA